MKRIISTAVIVIFLVGTFSGCATTFETGNKTVTGGALGAITGAAIGFVKTGKLEGALTGAAIGGGSWRACGISYWEV